MLLGDLLKEIEYTECLNFRECEILGVSEHSSRVREGFVFVCVKGNFHNGENFVKSCKERGAVAIVTTDKSLVSEYENVIIVENPRKCEAEISKALFGKEIDKLKIIGITGTKGKTTTAKILSECISHLGLKCVSIGTLGVEYYEGDSRMFLTGKSENTTPDAPFIYRALADAYEDGARVAVLEVSSQALINYRVYGIPFTVCIYTNFSYDHVGEFEHGSMAEYLEAKRTLFCDYGCKICIVNSDDGNASLISRGMEHVVSYGKTSNSFRLLVESSDAVHSEFTINGKRFIVSLGGDFNAYNAAAAVVGASLICGRDVEEFLDVLKKVSVIGRYELYKIKEKTVIIDFAHNGDSFRSILSSVRYSTNGRIITLFGSVGERSLSRRGELARAAEEFSDFIVITSDNPGNESVDNICADIYNAIADNSIVKIITDRECAIKFAIEFANENDTILLLGKGHEEFQLIGDRKIPFSERDIIKLLGAVRVYN